MSAFTASATLPHPPGRVFDLLADARRHGEWIVDDAGGPLRPAIEITNAGGPEVGEGAAYRLIQRMGSRTTADYTFRTAVFDPPRRLEFRADGGYDVVFGLEEEGEGTRLTYTREYPDRPRGLVGRLLARRVLTAENVEPGIRAELGRIAEALEAQPRPAAARG